VGVEEVLVGFFRRDWPADFGQKLSSDDLECPGRLTAIAVRPHSLGESPLVMAIWLW
jgi:hypothetical protein